jgi:phosphatidylserine decarboxylase
LPQAASRDAGAVAAILVASIRLHCLDEVEPQLPRPQRHPATRRIRKGEELGWFEHGSTIIVFAPDGFALCDGVREPLLRLE